MWLAVFADVLNFVNRIPGNMSRPIRNDVVDFIAIVIAECANGCPAAAIISAFEWRFCWPADGQDPADDEYERANDD